MPLRVRVVVRRAPSGPEGEEARQRIAQELGRRRAERLVELAAQREHILGLADETRRAAAENAAAVRRRVRARSRSCQGAPPCPEALLR